MALDGWSRVRAGRDWNSLRETHQQWIDIHLRELLAPNADRLALAEDQLAGSDVNETHARWLSEAVAHESTLAITWDQPLLNQSAGLDAIEVVTPTSAWSTLSVPNGTHARIAPSPTNPLSRKIGGRYEQADSADTGLTWHNDEMLCLRPFEPWHR